MRSRNLFSITKLINSPYVLVYELFKAGKEQRRRGEADETEGTAEERKANKSGMEANRRG